MSTRSTENENGIILIFFNNKKPGILKKKDWNAKISLVAQIFRNKTFFYIKFSENQKCSPCYVTPIKKLATRVL